MFPARSKRPVTPGRRVYLSVTFRNAPKAKKEEGEGRGQEGDGD